VRVAAIIAAVLALACARAQGLAAPDAGQLQAEVDDLSRDVDLLARLNQLQLSTDQVKALGQLAKRRQEAAAAGAAKRAEILTALAQALRQKRQLLLGDQPSPEALENKIAQHNTELQALSQGEKEQCKALLADLRTALTPAQLAVLTGKLEAKRNALEMLEWLRGLKDAEYEDEADGAAQELDSPDRNLPAEKIRAVLDRARKLDAAGFEKQKGALADELLPAYALSPAAEDDALMDLIGDQRLGPLLEDKLAVLGG
jgi:hypothetical protein